MDIDITLDGPGMLDHFRRELAQIPTVEDVEALAAALGRWWREATARLAEPEPRQHPALVPCILGLALLGYGEPTPDAASPPPARSQ